jgi:hypothetical protein
MRLFLKILGLVHLVCEYFRYPDAMFLIFTLRIPVYHFRIRIVDNKLSPFAIPLVLSHLNAPISSSVDLTIF